MQATRTVQATKWGDDNGKLANDMCSAGQASSFGLELRTRRMNTQARRRTLGAPKTVAGARVDNAAPCCRGGRTCAWHQLC